MSRLRYSALIFSLLMLTIVLPVVAQEKPEQADIKPILRNTLLLLERK